MSRITKTRNVTLLICIFLFASQISGQSQSVWDLQGKYLTKDGVPTFFSGVNYVPSYGWLTHLEIWDPAKVEEDFVHLKKAGVNNIRYLPLWPQLQKSKEGGYVKNLQKLDYVIALAAKHDISVQLGLLNSWMSGGTFLPEWADGNIFTESELIDAQKNLIRDIVSRYKDNDIIQAYDIGNELNVLDEWMHLNLKTEEVESWLAQIVSTIRQHDPGHAIINGVGTGFTDAFNVETVSKYSDMMATHSYPYFHGTSRFDPWIGQRTAYSTNYIICWAEMMGQPVVMQELGSSEQWMPPRDIPKYLHITFLSNWAEGAAGYLWWCSHDIPQDFKVSDKGLFKKYSTPRVRRQNQFSELNYDMGILDAQNRMKPVGHAFKNSASLVDRLGVGWKDELPVCYILIPEDHSYDRTMIKMIHPFVLVKQAHMDVKLHFEKNPIPPDASAIVIPGFALSENGKKHVSEYLHEGGIVYQSFYKDFADDIVLSTETIRQDQPLLSVNSRQGLYSLGEKFTLPFTIEIQEVLDEGDATRILSLSNTQNVIKEDREHDTDFFEDEDGMGLYYHVNVGKGDYYYSAVDLERGLMSTYDGWETNQAYKFYSAFRSSASFDLDENQIELYHKVRDTEEILVLINHTNSFKNATIFADTDVRLTELEDSDEELTGRTIPVFMAPAEVLIFVVKR